MKVVRLVVLGHGQCGGVRAMAYGPPRRARDFIASWVEIGKPALAAAARRGRDLGRIEAEVVRLSLANLKTFPWIAEAAATGRLALQGYLFDVHTGVLASVKPEAQADRVTGGCRNLTLEAFCPTGRQPTFMLAFSCIYRVRFRLRRCSCARRFFRLLSYDPVVELGCRAPGRLRTI